VTANSPAPAAPADIVAHDEVQAAHVAETVATTTAKVQTLVPGFKRSIWHSPESQYKSAWNKAVEAGSYPATLKV